MGDAGEGNSSRVKSTLRKRRGGEAKREEKKKTRQKTVGVNLSKNSEAQSAKAGPNQRKGERNRKK